MPLPQQSLTNFRSEYQRLPQEQKDTFWANACVHIIRCEREGCLKCEAIKHLIES